MSHAKTLLLIFSVLPIALFAQKKELKVRYGKISDAEMTMKSAPIDPAAPAVVLFDKGRISHRYVNNSGFLLEFERHVRIKVFQKEAYHLADVAIFHFNSQKINDLKASSYNLENGKIVETKIDKDNVFDEKLTRTRMVKKVTIPAVREGTVLEYKYTISDEGAIGMQDWVFQREEVPTLWSEFEASVPAFIEFRKMSQGWEPFALAEENQKTENISIQFTSRSDGSDVNAKTEMVRVEYTTNTMHFIQENIPALKPEPFVYSVRDYLSQINFDIRAVYDTDLVPSGTGYQIVNGGFKERNISWEKLGREMLEDVFQEILKSSKHTEEAAKNTIAGKAAGTEQIAAIYAHIGQNYQNTGMDYLWPSQTLENLVKNRKGTPTDLNLLLVNMLRRVQVNAHPVLVSTRKNGRILPFRVTTEALNRVIAAVPLEENNVLLLDMAGWPNPFGLIPETDLNGEGLLLKDAEFIRWIPLQNTVPVRLAVMADLAIDPEKGLSGSFTFSDNGYGAVEARAKIREKDATSFVREKFTDLIADGQLSSLNIENTEQWQEPGIKGSFNLETSAFATVSGNKIYLAPSLGFGWKENPFKNPERKFNIDFGAPKNLALSFSFKIPPGYIVEEAPKSTKMMFDENALAFDYLVETSPEKIKISIRQNIRKPYIIADKYGDLQQFFGAVIAKMEEQIVLTKN